MTDPGLAAHLRQADIDDLSRPELARGAEGPIIEGFVATELIRLAAFSALRPALSHYRDRRGAEVDLIIESRGRVAAIEVKAGASIDRSALRHLTGLRDKMGERFVAGIVLHTDHTAQQLGDRLHSMPIAALWE